ncbi:glycosyltransferase family 2 protein [Paracoccus sp. 1_MG-2023]|uniref:glycosyltransferase family 2 protein n=1 Tax=unclassified Paracoccus (in: a-proteobacteria) TaxID=2688777 RepID=UPI002090BF9D|nr:MULTISPECIES: glycosyltransferase family 2 protein [unclassified Paracoccus (in: a-proteobacteria)]MDO6670077.1 glycosyltransferase family 2 protein [Paracoccus sp. 1_MG-2023]
MGRMHEITRDTAIMTRHVLRIDTSAPDLSFVIPAYNEAETIVETLDRVSRKAGRLVPRSEIIVVDDGSRDGTADLVQAGDWAVPVRLLRLSRNFGKEQAIMAGLRHAAGKAVVILDADLQEPLRYVDAMLQKYREGHEIVYAVRAHRDDESWLKRRGTAAFYRFLNIGSEVPIPAGARDFRLMDRKVVDALCALPETNRFMKGLYAWVGFRTFAIPVELQPRGGGSTKFGFRRLLRLGMTGLTAFTDWPLRMWTGIGMVLASMSILYGLFLAARTLLLGHDLPGWSTLAVAIFFFGGIQVMSIGVLGEYLACVFNEVKGRPGYLIAQDVTIARAPEC